MTTPDDPYAAPDPESTPPANPYGQPPAPGYGPPSGAPGQPQSPYGQPQYGQPAYAQPAYGQPAYGQKPGTNGLAIASLVCAIAGLITCGIASIVGFILGLVALSQIKKSRQGGRGLALAGVWISVVIVVIGIIGAIVFGVFVSSEIEKCDNGTYTGQQYQDHCVNDDF